MTNGKSRAGYEQALERLRAQFAALPPGAPVRLAKRTSNLFRPRAATRAPGLDVAAFADVVSIDAAGRTADVGGMTSYERLVDATLPHGLMPLVVPQLKTITLGGAVTGLGIESSSFRNGLPHESVLDMDVLTGDGRVLRVAPGGEHDDLYAGFPNSYGTLGYALRLRIELEPVAPFVHVEHRPVTDVGRDLGPAVAAAVAENAEDGVAFVDGTVFSPQEAYVTVGRWSQTAPAVSDYTLTEVYYRSLQQRRQDYLTTAGYLWRWDTDWFWCSRAFGVQTRPWLRRLLGRKRLRSDTWWQLVSFERRHGIAARVDRIRGRPDNEYVVQDVEVPVDALGEWLAFLDRQTGIRPVWVCPFRTRNPARRWPLYPLDPTQLWVNVGFWSAVALPPGQRDGYHNRAIERELDRIGGRKSLYSTSFYPREEFDQRYGGSEYTALKARYDPDRRLLDLYDKTVRRR
ncbi:MAG: FAD-binding protein [Frankiaceae bacterium]